MSEVGQNRFVAELSEMVDRFVPDVTPGEMIVVLAYAAANCALASQRPDLTRETFVKDLGDLGGRAYDDIIEQLAAKRGENEENVH